MNTATHNKIQSADANPSVFLCLDDFRNYQRLSECLALLERRISEDEQREAAMALRLKNL